MKPSFPRFHVHLVVEHAARAIEFYEKALGAKEVVRYADPNLGGLIVHAELALGEIHFTLAEQHPEWKNLGPNLLGGSPVVLTLEVEDADATGARMREAGAKEVFPIADQFYGKREGRFADPFGHLWVISQVLEDLSKEEIQRRVDSFSS